MAEPRAVLALLLVLPVLVQALTCHNASMFVLRNQVHNVPLTNASCSPGVEFCVTRYFNDGEYLRYEIGCDEAKQCKTSGCAVDSTPTRTCCCTDDNCVPAGASDAIKIPFKPDFTFSTATAAYQIEGAAFEDGKAANVWDVFSNKPGRIANNDTGNVACDSYHQWERDVEMLKAIGVHHYRFSLSWTRLLPTNDPRKPNRAGVRYYHNLIDALLANNIQPVVTLFHWDLPQSLMDEGGFLDDTISDKFAAYAAFAFAEYGRKVKNWVTINEPASLVKYAYCGEVVVHAPGPFKSHCEWSIYRAGHNILLSHSKASKIYRTLFKPLQQGKIGIVISGTWFYPMTESPEDAAASERAWQWTWGWWTHPIFAAGGDYPQVMRDRIANSSINLQHRSNSRLPTFTNQERQDLINSADFIGVNYYRSLTVRARTSAEYDFANFLMNMDSGIETGYRDDWELFSWIWNVPDGLRRVLNRFQRDFPNVALVITENGMMDVNNEGLDDRTRIRYLRGHLSNIALAAQDGANVQGYTLWSLMDNFEWNDGYATKFGIHRVDFQHPNRTRTPKASVAFYRNVIQEHAVTGFSIN